MRTGHAGREHHELGDLARGRQKLRQPRSLKDDHLAVRMRSALRRRASGCFQNDGCVEAQRIMNKALLDWNGLMSE